MNFLCKVLSLLSLWIIISLELIPNNFILAFHNGLSVPGRFWEDSKWYAKCNKYKKGIDENKYSFDKKYYQKPIIDENGIHYVQFMTSEMFKEVYEIQHNTCK